MASGSLVDGKARHAIGLDYGATNARAGLVRDDGQILKLVQRTSASFLGDPERIVGTNVLLIEELLSLPEVSVVALDGIGIATAGQVDLDGVIVTVSSRRGFPWEPLPLRALVKQRLPVEVPVTVRNHSVGAAWAEFLYGAGRGTRDMIYLSVGTSIGGGLVLNGKVFLGADGFAGHLGSVSVDMHGPPCLTGMVGGVECYASGSGIGRAARQALEEGHHSAILKLAGGETGAVSSELVFEAARAGDALAREIVGNAAYALGIAIASMLHVFNPDVVVIGGGVAEQGGILLDPVRRTVVEYTMPNFARAPIRQAQLGDLAGVMGAAAFCWE